MDCSPMEALPCFETNLPYASDEGVEENVLVQAYTTYGIAC
jgi:hypothetical protein